MTDRFITLKEAAALLGYTPGTLQKKCQGNPPEMAHYRIAGRPRFKLSELMRYVERFRIEARPACREVTVTQVYSLRRQARVLAHKTAGGKKG